MEKEKIFLRLQAQAKEKKLTKDKILKDIRKVRRKLYREEFGND